MVVNSDSGASKFKGHRLTRNFAVVTAYKRHPGVKEWEKLGRGPSDSCGVLSFLWNHVVVITYPQLRVKRLRMGH